MLDPSLLPIANVTSGLKENGILIINTKKSFQDIKSEFEVKQKLATVDATSIAREILGIPITNTTMIGALIRATGVVKLESFIEPLKHRFNRLAEKNTEAMKTAYEQTLVKEKA